jgi:hypothetical protein
VIFRERQLTGEAATLQRAKALASKMAGEERRAGRVGRIVLADLGGNLI